MATPEEIKAAENQRKFDVLCDQVANMPKAVWAFDGGTHDGAKRTMWWRLANAAKIVWEYDGADKMTIWARLVEASRQQAVILDALKALETSVQQAAASPGASVDNVVQLVTDRLSSLQFTLQPSVQEQEQEGDQE